MNSLCTKPLNKGHLCIVVKIYSPNVYVIKCQPLSIERVLVVNPSRASYRSEWAGQVPDNGGTARTQCGRPL